MGRRIVGVLELLIIVTLFSLFAALVITTNSNDRIIEQTEEFVELVRYKGCITSETYNEFLNGFNTPVDVSISVTRKPNVTASVAVETMQFDGDIAEALAADNIYRMNVGDEIQVVVRKASASYYDSIVSMLTGSGRSNNPAIAIKGGMILNTQYAK